MIYNKDGKEIVKVLDNQNREIDTIYDKDGRIVYSAYGELTGVPPMYFKGRQKSLLNYHISGNTIQNGEPSPDNPVEVVGVGERTGNLINFEESIRGIAVNNNNVIVNNINFNLSYANVSGLQEVSLSGCTINNAINLVWCDNKKNILSTAGLKQNGTYSVPDDAIYMGISIANDNSSSPDYSRIMLTPDTTVPDHYIPYGYEVDVETRGVNLCPLDFGHRGVVDDNGNTTVYNSRLWTRMLPVSPSHTYSAFINGMANNGESLYFNRIIQYDSDGNFISRLTVGTNTAITFSVSDNCSYVILDIRSASLSVNISDDNVYEIMLTPGSTPPSHYEPYHEPITTPVYIGDEPLHKIGEYADYAVRKNDGTKSRFNRIKKLVLTGAERVGNEWGVFTISVLPSINTSSKITVKCNHYIGSINAPATEVGLVPYSIKFRATYNTICIKDPDFEDVDAFKSFLSAQYSAGTPVTIWYVLAEPEEIPLENLNPIPTINGTNVLSVEAQVQPSEMYIKGKIKPLGYGDLVDVNDYFIQDNNSVQIQVHGQ